MTAHAFEAVPPTLPSGRVRLRDGERFTVTLQGGDVIAKRAASCLLVPEPGDHVLLTLSPSPFVLAVLERGEGQAVVELPEEVSVRAGRLELQGEHGVAISTKGPLSLTADRTSLRSRLTELATHDLTTIAKRARAHLESANLVSETLDVVTERITSRAARVFRFVTELDQLRARHFDHRADHSARVHAENTVITATEVVKLDGEQIHVG